MKRIILALAIVFLFSSLGFAKDVYVQGYTRKDGTYVNSYHRSSPDNTVTNNYDYKGNVNPYTGEEGHNYYRGNPTSAYYQPGVQQQNNNVQAAPMYNSQRSSSYNSNQLGSSNIFSQPNTNSYGPKQSSPYGSNSGSLFGSGSNSGYGSELGQSSGENSDSDSGENEEN